MCPQAHKTAPLVFVIKIGCHAVTEELKPHSVLPFNICKVIGAFIL